MTQYQPSGRRVAIASPASPEPSRSPGPYEKRASTGLANVTPVGERTYAGPMPCGASLASVAIETGVAAASAPAGTRSVRRPSDRADGPARGTDRRRGRDRGRQRHDRRDDRVARGVVDRRVEDVEAPGRHLHEKRRVVGDRDGREEILDVRLRPAPRPERARRGRHGRARRVLQRQRVGRPVGARGEADVRAESRALPDRGHDGAGIGGRQEREERNGLLLGPVRPGVRARRVHVARPAEDRDGRVRREAQRARGPDREAEERSRTSTTSRIWPAGTVNVARGRVRVRALVRVEAPSRWRPHRSGCRSARPSGRTRRSGRSRARRRSRGRPVARPEAPRTRRATSRPSRCRRRRRSRPRGRG